MLKIAASASKKATKPAILFSNFMCFTRLYAA